jgi:hypothetical protein
MGLPPVETARGRIDLILDVHNGKVANDVTACTGVLLQDLQRLVLDHAPKADAVQWLNEQFGTNLQ